MKAFENSFAKEALQHWHAGRMRGARPARPNERSEKIKLRARYLRSYFPTYNKTPRIFPQPTDFCQLEKNTENKKETAVHTPTKTVLKGPWTPAYRWIAQHSSVSDWRKITTIAGAMTSWTRTAVFLSLGSIRSARYSTSWAKFLRCCSPSDLPVT